MKYLALGDSYTIGELVAVQDSFPYQLTAWLEQHGFPDFDSPRIIAKTGWTSEELYQQIESQPDITQEYDLVTLLIGVNDQYRGLNIAQYEKYFLKLLLKAIFFARGQSRRVYVLSIPDWGVTPFAEGKDKNQIASDIDEFNKRNKLLTLAYRCHYLNITPLSRHQGLSSENLASDQLHYSGLAYKGWAEKAGLLIRDTFPKA